MVKEENKLWLKLMTDTQDTQTEQKQYAPDLRFWGHKKARKGLSVSANAKEKKEQDLKKTFQQFNLSCLKTVLLVACFLINISKGSYTFFKWNLKKQYKEKKNSVI